MTTPRKFQLGSEKEETPRGDRLLGLQRLQEKNRACEHVVVVGDGFGAATLAVKMRGQDVCPHCTRREAAYWRERGKTAEGILRSSELNEQRLSTIIDWVADALAGQPLHANASAIPIVRAAMDLFEKASP